VTLYWVVTSFAYETSCFLAADFFVLMVGCEEVVKGDVKGCGRLRVHDGLLDVAWFCVY
jgi:hypothetical protein